MASYATCPLNSKSAGCPAATYSWLKRKSEKASDTLLKLAMSLAALGEKDEACSTFGELDAKYPNAPEAVRDQAKSERARAGC